MWVTGPALVMISGFFFFFPLPTALAVGFLLEESSPSSVFIGGLLCGRPPGARDP